MQVSALSVVSDSHLSHPPASADSLPNPQQQQPSSMSDTAEIAADAEQPPEPPERPSVVAEAPTAVKSDEPVEEPDHDMEEDDEATPIKDDSNWEENFTKLLKFRAEHGHVNVPSRYTGDPHLGCWGKSLGM
jgi:hypothetical protein